MAAPYAPPFRTSISPDELNRTATPMLEYPVGTAGPRPTTPSLAGPEGTPTKGVTSASHWKAPLSVGKARYRQVVSAFRHPLIPGTVSTRPPEAADTRLTPLTAWMA